MTIGLVKAFFYYRQRVLWETFFHALDCVIVTGPDTGRPVLEAGILCTVDESCLPMKIFSGQVQALDGRCDYLLVPRLEAISYNEEYCVRFFGLPDAASHILEKSRLLTYDIRPGFGRGEAAGFLCMGLSLGCSPTRTLRAYRDAKATQQKEDRQSWLEQEGRLAQPGLKVLLAAQSYLLHDGFVGGPIVRMLRELGVEVLYSDRCDRAACQTWCKELSRDLYWVMNREILGAVQLLKQQVDGIIFLTAFPCGTDCLANELALRRLEEVPAIQLLLDEQGGEAGLQTRIESFVDILHQRKARHVS